MIVIISPAKSMNFESNMASENSTVPFFQKDADYLAGRLKKLKLSDLGKLMDISPKLAQLNTERYTMWDSAPMKVAIHAYNGDVYDGLQASLLNENEIEFAQKYLRILSGLYGLLKPLDEIKPYRIEMSTRFTTPKGENLYKFWGNRITDQLKKNIKESGSNILINLASQEYFTAINSKKLNTRIITPSFKDKSNGRYAVVSFFAKRARGMMSRFIIQNSITDPEMIIGFDENGYNFNHGLSKGDNWVFTRG